MKNGISMDNVLLVALISLNILLLCLWLFIITFVLFNL